MCSLPGQAAFERRLERSSAVRRRAHGTAAGRSMRRDARYLGTVARMTPARVLGLTLSGLFFVAAIFVGFSPVTTDAGFRDGAFVCGSAFAPDIDTDVPSGHEYRTDCNDQLSHKRVMAGVLVVVALGFALGGFAWDAAPEPTTYPRSQSVPRPVEPVASANGSPGGATQPQPAPSSTPPDAAASPDEGQDALRAEIVELSDRLAALMERLDTAPADTPSSAQQRGAAPGAGQRDGDADPRA